MELNSYGGRHFDVSCVTANVDKNEIINIFGELGYVLEKSSERRLIFRRGSKLATYAGLVNWKLIYRRVDVELIEPEKILIKYIFPWLTNIGLLSRAAKPELEKIKKMFNASDITFLRKR